MKQEQFEITEQHLKLIQRMYMEHDTYAFLGGPSTDFKRPFGNSDIEQDIGEILDIEPEGIDEYDSEVKVYTEAQQEKFREIYKDVAKALQICMNLQKFETGIYQQIKSYNTRDWKKIK